MPFGDVLYPRTLTLLTRVLDKHCDTHGIKSDEGRSSVAQSLMEMHKQGINDEDELLRRLDLQDRPK